jgi:hypothetical protein
MEENDTPYHYTKCNQIGMIKAYNMQQTIVPHFFHCVN